MPRWRGDAAVMDTNAGAAGGDGEDGCDTDCDDLDGDGIDDGDLDILAAFLLAYVVLHTVSPDNKTLSESTGGRGDRNQSEECGHHTCHALSVVNFLFF